MRALVIVCLNCSKLPIISYLPTQNLLSDTEVLEDVAQDLIGGDVTGDG